MYNSNYYDYISKILYFLEEGSLTRKEISDILDISLSTAGNIVSELISAGIVCEYSQANSVPGRKTKSLILTHSSTYALVHITHEYFFTEYFSNNLKTRKTEKRQISEPIFIDDCFTELVRDISNLSPSVKGIAFVCHGIPNDHGFKGSNIPGFDNVPVFDIAKELLKTTTVFVENNALNYLLEKNGLNIVYDERNSFTKLSIILDGVLISGRSGLSGCIDRLINQNSRSFGNAVKYAKNFDEYTSALAELFYNIILLLDPHRILINTDRYSATSEIIRTVSEKLMINYKIDLPDIPDIIGKSNYFDPDMKNLRRKIRDTAFFMTDSHD